jgi:hypothetical protein
MVQRPQMSVANGCMPQLCNLYLVCLGLLFWAGQCVYARQLPASDNSWAVLTGTGVVLRDLLQVSAGWAILPETYSWYQYTLS